MKNMGVFILAVVMIFILSTLQNADASRKCSLNSEEVDQFLDNLERKIPYLEQEATLIVKMLNSKKHLTNIKEDLKIISDRSPKLRPEDTHLFRAWKAYKLSPDKLSITLEDNNYQLVCKGLHKRILVGGCYRNASITDLLPDLSLKQIKKSAELMNEIIDILTPVGEIVNEKISDSDLADLKEHCFISISKPDDVYYILDHVQENAHCGYDCHFHGLDFIWRNPIAAKNFFVDNKIPNVYLDMLKNYINFLSISKKYAPPEKGWKYYIKAIDEILAEKAESGDEFSDISDESPADNNIPTAGENSGDLNIDNLKLPN